MKIIDIHCHLQFSDFDTSTSSGTGIPRDEILQQMTERQQGAIVVGTNAETSQSAIVLANQHENIWATAGQHPTVVDDFDITIYRNMFNGRQKSKIVAVGECGFDFFRVDRDVDFDRQLKLFQSQVDLAAEFQLPLMLHGRPTKNTMNAYEDMLEILSQRRGELPEHPGNAHFFVGDLEIAKRFLDLNFTLSFDGPITFARDYDEVIKYVPSDMIHAETDAPYAAPVPHRGQQNSPLYVEHVIDSLIDIRNESDSEAFRLQLVENAKRVFNL